MPGNLRGIETHSQKTRHLDSETNTCNENTTNTEIVNHKKTQRKIVVGMGDRDQKALWDSGAGHCLISFECYNAIPDKYKTELFHNKIKIRAANGSQIDNKGEFDITFRIGKEKFTLPFLVSSELAQQIFLGFNLGKVFHIATEWDSDDQMSLMMNGHIW